MVFVCGREAWRSLALPDEFGLPMGSSVDMWTCIHL